MARIEALYVGKPAWRRYGEREVYTSAHRLAVAEVLLGALGFEGDAPGDARVHGGPDKAVCFYPAEHYRHWESVLGAALQPPAFGENITHSGMVEAEVCIGDIFEVGGAAVQVTQPRQPCAKLAARHGRPDLPDLVFARGFTGFYGRVIEAGLVRAGDPIVVRRRDPAGVAVTFATEVMHRKLADRSVLERLLSVEALSKAWRETLTRRLSGGE